MNSFVGNAGDSDAFNTFIDATLSEENGRKEVDKGAGNRSAVATALEWENPSYTVKDLEMGESYRVEQPTQLYTLVTLNTIVQHEVLYVWLAR